MRIPLFLAACCAAGLAACTTPEQPPAELVGPPASARATAGNPGEVRHSPEGDGGHIVKLTGHWDTLTAVGLSRDGKVAVTASADLTLRVWDLSKGLDRGTELTRIVVGNQPVSALQISPDATRLLAGAHDKSVRLYALPGGRPLREMRGHSRFVSAVTFSPDGARGASGSADGVVKIWDLATGALKKSFAAHVKTVNQLAFSGDGTRLLSAGDDKTAVIWDVASGKPVKRFLGHASWVTACAWSPDGTRILTGSADRTVKLWDARTGAALATFKGPVGPVSRVGFARGGKLAVAGGGIDQRDPDPEKADFAVRIWDVTTGLPVATLTGHRAAVVALRELPGGMSLVSAGLDETVRTWRLPP